MREGEALGVSEGRLPFSRSSPPGHAVVQRCGGRKCTDGMWDSGGGVGDGRLCLLVVVDGKEAHLRACSLRVVGEMC